MTIEDGLVLGAQLREQILQMRGARLDRPCEADLFPRQIVEDRAAALFQFLIEATILRDDGFRYLRQERLAQADLRPEAGGAADDHARYIVASRVAGHHTIRDQEGRRADMVSNDAVGREVRVDLLAGRAGQRGEHVHRAGEQVGFVVRVDALQDRDDALEAHAGVYVLLRQRLEAAVVIEVVLDEDIVPQLEVARALAVHPADVVGAAQVVALFPQVDVDLRARPAGTCFRHLPEILMAPEEQNMRRVKPGLFLPDICGFIVARDAAPFILEAGCIEFVLGQAPNIGQQLPRPGDGFLLVIIAE